MMECFFDESLDISEKVFEKIIDMVRKGKIKKPIFLVITTPKIEEHWLEEFLNEEQSETT